MSSAKKSTNEGGVSLRQRRMGCVRASRLNAPHSSWRRVTTEMVVGKPSLSLLGRGRRCRAYPRTSDSQPAVRSKRRRCAGRKGKQ